MPPEFGYAFSVGSPAKVAAKSHTTISRALAATCVKFRLCCQTNEISFSHLDPIGETQVAHPFNKYGMNGGNDNLQLNAVFAATAKTVPQ